MTAPDEDHPIATSDVRVFPDFGPDFANRVREEVAMEWADLVEFLLARIDEEASGAVAAQVRDGDAIPLSPGVWDYSRVLAQCEATRRIVGLVNSPGAMVLRLLALPYARHPDFNPAWSIDV